MDGWMDGWVDGGKSGVKDCLQQSKNIPVQIKLTCTCHEHALKKLN